MEIFLKSYIRNCIGNKRVEEEWRKARRALVRAAAVAVAVISVAVEVAVAVAAVVAVAAGVAVAEGEGGVRFINRGGVFT